NINEQKGKNPIQFEHDEPIVIYGAEFVARLDKLLPTFEPRVVQNYLTWLMMVQKLRWHGCVTRVNSLMPMATSSIYVKHHFDNEAKAQVEEMIALIMEAFVELLDEEEWLTGETKAYAKQKIKTMHQKIGYPDYLENNTAVNKEYERYIVYESDYYKTKFQFYEMYQKDILEKIRMPVDRNRWVAGAALVNAFYSPNTNEIIFPAGILQPVFYSKHFPRSMNFGGIGYSNYVLDQISMKINGRSTKGENIADNGGLKQAYRAYKKYERYRSLPQQLPGVNLTHDQLFFLNYAQIWCGIMNDKEAVRKLRTSEHSPGPIRVKGPLSNSVDFAAAYNCPEGSPMNPIQKCKVCLLLRCCSLQAGNKVYIGTDLVTLGSYYTGGIVPEKDMMGTTGIEYDFVANARTEQGGVRVWVYRIVCQTERQQSQPSIPHPSMPQQKIEDQMSNDEQP
uniref:Uncharacterized protein n=1 Tax=Meloidogyne javanica TaxID=6303 RepID=A0A915LK09_MELJA